MIIGFDIGKLDKALVFIDLGLREVIIVIFEDGGGIGHGAIKPGTVEVISKVIMIGNVACRTSFIVTPEQVKELQPKTTHRIRPERNLQITVMHDRKLDQFRQVRAGNLAVDYGLAKPHLAITQHLTHRIS